MEIDWLTVAAQVVNFLILVWLLRHFLYGPVTAAMARREERIRTRIEDSREREQQAEAERERLHQRLAHLEERREAILAQAREEAEGERRTLLDSAREESDAARRRWQEQARREREDFLGELRRRSAEGFQTLARRALGDLAETGLEEQMARALAARLADLDADTRQALAQGDGPVRVTSAFPLTDAARERIGEAIAEHLRPDAEVRYGEARGLLCGIELTANDHRLGWTLGDYLDRLEASVGVELDERRAGSGATGSR
jgi:F-type H+-transporting ATPase subunit b